MSRFLPKSIVCFREGCTARQLAGDLVAGVTVGIIALPLAIAFGIASIPQEVVDTARQAGQVIIFSSQIKDFFGLRIDSVPAEFVDKWRAYFEHSTY